MLEPATATQLQRVERDYQRAAIAERDAAAKRARAVAAAIDAGASLRAIADEIGVTRTRVQQLVEQGRKPQR